jgi:hypothetical protein
VPIVESHELWSKTNRKDQDSNPAPPRDKKMPQFVKKYDKTENEQEGEQVAEEIVPKCM